MTPLIEIEPNGAVAPCFIGHTSASTHASNGTDFGPIAANLERMFGAEFSFVDARTGAALSIVDAHRNLDWLVLGPLCSEAAARSGAELIREEDPLLILALPVHSSDGRACMAVGAFLSRRPASEADLLALARQMNLSVNEAREWAARQTPTPVELLLRMRQMAVEKMAAERRAERLQAEASNLSFQLSSTYEEISLIYRLTQNLKISDRADELAESALSWLADVIPAKGIAILLSRNLVGDGRTEDDGRYAMFMRGDCQLDRDELTALAIDFDVAPGKGPLVFNRQTNVDGMFVDIRINQMVVVALAEGHNLFGWLVAINHCDNEEFGTVEASLLSSVATILGIHGGNTDLYRQQADLLAGIIRALTSAIDAKDPYTCGHSDRVARIAVRLAQELGCSDEAVQKLYFAGLLHDIGKIGIDDQVLRKPGRLTDEEFEHIKTHTLIGHKILQGLTKMEYALPVVLHHHESWDGTGYPHQLAGENIPFTARILAVADAYDAMASDRPYRTGMPRERLEEILRSGAGVQWDPKVVEAFFRVSDEVRAIYEDGTVDACPPPSVSMPAGRA